MKNFLQIFFVPLRGSSSLVLHGLFTVDLDFTAASVSVFLIPLITCQFTAVLNLPTELMLMLIIVVAMSIFEYCYSPWMK